MGVEQVRWPEEFGQVRAVTEKLPRRLVGESRELYSSDGEDGGPSAGAAYGEAATLQASLEYLTDDTESGQPEVFTAGQQLGAQFNLVLSCAPNSYSGTIRQLHPRGGPGMSEKTSPAVRWFSCRIDGAEGDDDFTGHAIGWTRGKGAWLIYGEDKRAAKALVAALQRAAGR